MILPPVTLIQLLPVSLAGWGVRELALVVVLSSFGVSAEIALTISLLFGLLLIVTGLPGGLIWLTGWYIAPSGRVVALSYPSGEIISGSLRKFPAGDSSR